MSGTTIEEALTDRLLTEIFNRHVTSQGYSLNKLNKSHFQPISDYGIHELTFMKGNVKSYHTSDYLKELESRGYLVQDNITYRLTPAGYFQGYKQKHPARYLLRYKYSVYLPILFTSVTIIIGILNYLK